MDSNDGIYDYMVLEYNIIGMVMYMILDMISPFYKRIYISDLVIQLDYTSYLWI